MPVVVVVVKRCVRVLAFGLVCVKFFANCISKPINVHNTQTSSIEEVKFICLGESLVAAEIIITNKCNVLAISHIYREIRKVIDNIKICMSFLVK